VVFRLLGLIAGMHLKKHKLVRYVMQNDWGRVREVLADSHLDDVIWEDAVQWASKGAFTKPLEELLAGGVRTKSITFLELDSSETTPEVVSLLVGAGFSASELRLALRTVDNEKIWRAATSCRRNALGETPLNMAYRKDSLCAVSAHEVLWRDRDVHAIGIRARFDRLIASVVWSLLYAD
jgi:hypothetical protein